MSRKPECPRGGEKMRAHEGSPEQDRAERTRDLRCKRPALAPMGDEYLIQETKHFDRLLGSLPQRAWIE